MNEEQIQKEIKEQQRYGSFLQWYNEKHKDVDFWDAEP